MAVSLGYTIKPLTHIRETGLFKLFLLYDLAQAKHQIPHPVSQAQAALLELGERAVVGTGA